MPNKYLNERIFERRLNTFVEGMRTVIPYEWVIKGYNDDIQQQFVYDISRRLAERDEETEEPVDVKIWHSYRVLKPTLWNYFKFNVLRTLRFRCGLTAPFFQPKWSTYYETVHDTVMVKTKKVTKYIVDRYACQQIVIQEVTNDQAIYPYEPPKS